jgi:hypothetical protein
MILTIVKVSNLWKPTAKDSNPITTFNQSKGVHRRSSNSLQDGQVIDVSA